MPKTQPRAAGRARNQWGQVTILGRPGEARADEARTPRSVPHDWKGGGPESEAQTRAHTAGVVRWVSACRSRRLRSGLGWAGLPAPRQVNRQSADTGRQSALVLKSLPTQPLARISRMVEVIAMQPNTNHMNSVFLTPSAGQYLSIIRPE